jgi:hypothetical protein
VPRRSEAAALFRRHIRCLLLPHVVLHGADDGRTGALSREIRRVLRPGGLNVYTARNTNDPDFLAGIHRGEDLYEDGGFIVHFFNREKVWRLADDYELVGLEEFEEGGLPKRLFLVTLRRSIGTTKQRAEDAN